MLHVAGIDLNCLGTLQLTLHSTLVLHRGKVRARVNALREASVVLELYMAASYENFSALDVATFWANEVCRAGPPKTSLLYFLSL